MNNLEWCLKKLNEVAQDLREPQRGALLEHQAAKLDEVRDALGIVNERQKAIDAMYDRLKHVHIPEMVERFLAWPLPEDFAPDAGIEFKPTHPFGSPSWPTGTNLFDANQARAMILRLYDVGFPPAVHGGGTGED
jgi:hypothetical protein